MVLGDYYLVFVMRNQKGGSFIRNRMFQSERERNRLLQLVVFKHLFFGSFLKIRSNNLFVMILGKHWWRLIINRWNQLVYDFLAFWFISGQFIIYKQKETMVQVVHRYHGFYPFGIEQECDHQYLLVLKYNLTESEISDLRHKAKIIKQISCHHFIKVHKILREDNNLHIIYQYCKISIEQYLQTLKIKYRQNFPKESYRLLSQIFKNNVSQIISTLSKYNIRENIRISNMGCALVQEKQNFVLKYFLDTEAQFLSQNILEEINEADKHHKALPKVKEELLEFYDAERRSILLQFQELTQKYFGYVLNENQGKKTPNFVIQGTKLIFVHKQQKKEQAEQHKNTNPQGKTHFKSQEKIQAGTGKVPQNKKILINQLMRINKQKIKEQIIKKNIRPIINFDQSFQPIFQPEEIIRDNTYIVEENQYIQQLEDEIQEILSISNREENSKNSGKDCSKEEQKPSKNQKKETQILHTKGTQKSDHTSNSESYQHGNVLTNEVTNNSQPKINDYGNNKTQIKCQRLTKYKMKITTHHQIEINDNKEPNLQEIQQDIMNNIMTGKINMNNILGNEKKEFHPQITATDDQLTKSSSKEVSVGSTYASILQNEYDQQDFHKTQSIPAQQDEKNPQGTFPKTSKIQNKQIAELIENNRLKVQQKINESNIIKAQQSANSLKHQREKIALHSIKGQIEKPIKTEMINSKQEIVDEQKDSEELHRKNRISKMIQKISINPKTISSPAIEVEEKTNSPVKAQKESPERTKHVETAQKKENYLQKVREAKSKAEQILKEYTKKKA